ncbi:MAG: MFS transporter [Chloroflexi bacterium HGW-Chloroflexi-10]|nr:MAG: MFS transporter [Chloroflexi bacterium HGW-Chloroflexi-10]
MLPQFKNPKLVFYLIWFGQFVSILGSAMTRFAVIVWAYQQTQQTMILGWLGFFGYLPFVLVSPFAGVWIDRLDRKKILIFTDIGASLGTLFLFINFSTGGLQIWHLLLVEALIAIFEAFQSPAFSATIPQLVSKEDFSRANGLLSMADSTARIFAPILAGMILAFSNLSAVFMIDLVTFGIAMIVLVMVQFPTIKQDKKIKAENNFWFELRTGIDFIFRREGLVGLLIIFLFINLFAAITYYAILPALILSRTNGNQVDLGMVNAALSIGALTGGIIISTWKGPKKKVFGFLLATVMSFLFGDFLFAVGRSLPIWLLAAFASAIFIPAITGYNMTIWQSKVPRNLQGRVFSLRSMFQTIVMPLGYLLGGWLGDFVFEPAIRNQSVWAIWMTPLVGSTSGAGLGAMFLFTSILGTLTGISGFLFKKIRNVEDDLPDFEILENQFVAE